MTIAQAQEFVARWRRILIPWRAHTDAHPRSAQYRRVRRKQILISSVQNTDERSSVRVLGAEARVESQIQLEERPK